MFRITPLNVTYSMYNILFFDIDKSAKPAVVYLRSANTCKLPVLLFILLWYVAEYAAYSCKHLVGGDVGMRGHVRQVMQNGSPLMHLPAMSGGLIVKCTNEFAFPVAT